MACCLAGAKPGLVLGSRPANEKRRHKVMPSLIGLANLESALQVIIKTDVGILFIGLLGTNFSEILLTLNIFPLLVK